MANAVLGGVDISSYPINKCNRMKFTEFDISILPFNKIETTDWHGILKLRSEIFVLEQACVFVDPDVQDKSSLHLFVKSGHEIVGYARAFKDEIWHIGRIISDRNHREKGMASALLNSSIQHITSKEKDPIIELSAQVYLSDYYTSKSFKPSGKMYLEDGIPHLRMVYSPND